MLAEKHRAVILIHVTFAENYSKFIVVFGEQQTQIGFLYILIQCDFNKTVMNKCSK